MRLTAVLFAVAAPVQAQPPGKSTIAASHPMQSMQFMLKYLPVAVAEDNGVGNYGHGAVQGRTQTVLSTSYSAPNCQLYSAEGSASSGTKVTSMTPNGIGKACTYKSGSKTFGSSDTMYKVYANN